MFRTSTRIAIVIAVLIATALVAQEFEPGREVSVPRHLQDGEEFTLGLDALIQHGEDLFQAMWTVQEGGGRPLNTGVHDPDTPHLSDPESPLLFPRNFNRVSAPDANSCFACHNVPRSGGGGDFMANVFVLAQRFDFATFDRDDRRERTSKGEIIPTRGAFDERGQPVTLDDIANERASIGMFGAGYIEMLARQMTAELQAIRDAIGCGESRELVTKGVSFGQIRRRGTEEGCTFDLSAVEGLPAPSTQTDKPDERNDPLPTLIIRPFHQAGAVVSLREFTNNAFHHHHGMQSTERFEIDEDPDGDGFVNELTRADITAVSVYQATLAVPGRVIPHFLPLEKAVLVGEEQFEQIGCVRCHIPELPLEDRGWFYSEPNPFNPDDDLRPEDVPATLTLNLNSGELPPPRLRSEAGVTLVPAYTDLKLHDITRGPDDKNCEPLDMHGGDRSGDAFFAGNCKFITKKLWGIANEAPYFHHGKFTTIREAIEAHAGDAADSAARFRALTEYKKGSIIEFLKTLQVLPPGTSALVVDAKGQPREWPPRWAREGSGGAYSGSL